MPMLVGIVNCTPDSFSDAGDSCGTTLVSNLARRLIDDGADILDIGGDSTRPGSACVGPEQEWSRIAPVLRECAGKIRCSVDTHQPEVARRALDAGAHFINNISGEHSLAMVEHVRAYNACYIGMFNPHGGAHQFAHGVRYEDALPKIASWMSRTTHELEALGVPSRNTILDPGMGAFLSKDAEVSWRVVEHVGLLPSSTGGLLVGCSRKSFLTCHDDASLAARDYASALCGSFIAHHRSSSCSLHLRVHNVAQQRALLESGPHLDTIQQLRSEIQLLFRRNR